MPKWDKIFLSVYLRQIFHDPNLYKIFKNTGGFSLIPL